MKNQTRMHSFLLGRLQLSPRAAESLSVVGICFALWRSALTGADELEDGDLKRWLRSCANWRRELWGFRDWHGTKFYLVTEPGFSVIRVLMPDEL
jgi:hypothetical protein